MRRSMLSCGLLVLASCAAFAQPAEGPAFEVATIKPSPPQVGGRIMMGMSGGPGSRDPGHITATNVNLRMLLARAYNVKNYQIAGPNYIDTERFDIVAKVPAGATKEQVPAMFQNLLKERFKLALHHETKEMPMFALVAAKGGPKVKESAVQPAPQPGDNPPPGGPAPGAPPPPPTIGKDGMPQMPKGMGRGGLMMMMMNGRMRMVGNHTTMSQLVDSLAMQMDRPVTDMTGLTKEYDFTLDFMPENMGGMRGMPMPPPGAEGGGGGGGTMGGKGGGPGGDGGAMHGPDLPEGGELPVLAIAMQQQLGLKLDARKGPVDLLVIDSVEKAPTEN